MGWQLEDGGGCCAGWLVPTPGDGSWGQTRQKAHRESRASASASGRATKKKKAAHALEMHSGRAERRNDSSAVVMGGPEARSTVLAVFALMSFTELNLHANHQR